MSEQQLKVIEERWAKATPGPWAWRGNLTGKNIWLSARGRGLIVMDFVRWGMQSARMRFRDERDVMRDPTLIASTPHNAWDIVAIDHPDAEAIAAAPADIAALIAEVRRLQQATQ